MERQPVAIYAHFTPGQTPFMKFWKTVNDILKSHDKPELHYGEARDWFQQSGLKD